MLALDLPSGTSSMPADLQTFIRHMGHDNLLSGEERIGNERPLTLALRVSPRPVRTYLPTYRG